MTTREGTGNGRNSKGLPTAGKDQRMLASIVQRRVSIGSRVTFFRRDEQSVSGDLVEIGRDHLTIEDGGRLVTVLLDTITGWEVPTTNTDEAMARSGMQTRATDSNLSTTDQTTTDVSRIIVEVEVRFQAQLEIATIGLLHPDFGENLPGNYDPEAAKTWDRIRNRYQTAAKMNEFGAQFGRIQPLIRDLEVLTERYPYSPMIHRHLAYLYTLVHDERGGTHYRTAAVQSQEERDWFNLAAISLPDAPELTCCGLQRYFRLTRATDDLPAWYVFIRLVHRFSAYRALVEYLQVPQRSIFSEEARLLLETGIYLLKVTEGTQAAAGVASRWLVGESSADLALQAFRQIDRPPSEQFRQTASALDMSIAAQVSSSRKTIPRRPSRLPSESVRNHASRGRPRPVYSGPQPSQSGIHRWEKLYRDAALAQTEGRIPDARLLFRRAIEVGGGSQVYEALFKMEWRDKARRQQARSFIQQAIEKFPGETSLFNLYGQSERRIQQYQAATEVFRHGMGLHPDNVQLRMGLAQALVQIGTENNLQEAGKIFAALADEGKLHKKDSLYQRFRVLQSNPRVNKAIEFFQAAGMKTGIAIQRDLPPSITDIVVDVEQAELSESFGLSGSFLVRCFKSHPSPKHLKDLTEYIRMRAPQDEMVLQTGRWVVLNSSLVFISVPNANTVHDQVMRILSDNQAAVIPLDDAFLQHRDDPVQYIQEMLSRYLGQRDLYDSTQPVSGRRFFGRERLLVQLADALHSGQFLGIYGLRKIGKTSLVYQLRDEQLRHDAVAYVDLQASLALSTRNCGPLYWEVERALYGRLNGTNQHLVNLLRLGKEERFSSFADGAAQAPVLFAEDLRALLDAMAADQAGGIQHLVILLDELERILPVAGQPGVDGYLEFFGLLRGLAQTERYRGLLSCVVVAANAAISERGYWEGRENPVFALYKPFFVPPLPATECDAMIRSLGKAMSVYWERDATSAVYSETGGHPFLTRMLCSYLAGLVDQRPLQVTRRMVAAHVPPFLRDRGNLMEQITELLKTHFPDEARVLQQIALDEVPMETADETLRHLLSYRLIVEESNGYRVTPNLLCRWLRRRAGLRA